MLARGSGEVDRLGEAEVGEVILTKEDSKPADLRVIPSSELSSNATGTGTERGNTGFLDALSGMLARPLVSGTDFLCGGCDSSFEKTLVTVGPISGVSHTGRAPLASDDPRKAFLLLDDDDFWAIPFRNDSALTLGASLLNRRLPAVLLFTLSSKSAILALSIALSAFHSFRSFSNISRSLSKFSLWLSSTDLDCSMYAAMSTSRGVFLTRALCCGRWLAEEMGSRKATEAASDCARRAGDMTGEKWTSLDDLLSG